MRAGAGARGHHAVPRVRRSSTAAHTTASTTPPSPLPAPPPPPQSCGGAGPRRARRVHDAQLRRQRRHHTRVRRVARQIHHLPRPVKAAAVIACVVVQLDGDGAVARLHRRQRAAVPTLLLRVPSPRRAQRCAEECQGAAFYLHAVVVAPPLRRVGEVRRAPRVQAQAHCEPLSPLPITYGARLAPSRP